ncbi:MAG: hypothetical protein HZB53_06280 [Chloroflexi bacterium]|nr:hypothetical protein [Chloroflexota bacterium]
MPTKVRQEPKRAPDSTAAAVPSAPQTPSALKKWQHGAGNQAVQQEMRADGFIEMPPLVITASPPKPQASGMIEMPPLVVTASPPKSQNSGTIEMPPLVITAFPPKSQNSGTIEMPPLVVTASPPKPQDIRTIVMPPLVVTASPPKSGGRGTIATTPADLPSEAGGTTRHTNDAQPAGAPAPDQPVGAPAQPNAKGAPATPASASPSQAAPVVPPTAGAAAVGAPTVTPESGAAPAPASGPEISKWRASAVGAVKSLPQPKISSAANTARIRTSGRVASAKHKATSQRAGADADKAVSPAPKADQPPANPTAVPDPVPEATKVVNAAIEKRLPDQSVPGLEISPVTQLLPSLTPPPPAPVTPPGKTDPAQKPADAKEAKNPLKDKAAKVDQAAGKKAEQTEQRSDADPITLKDENRPKEKPFPQGLKSQLGPVIADLLQDTALEARAIVAGARRPLYGGSLERNFANLGDDKLLPDLKQALDTELRDVAHQAGLTDAEIQGEIEKRRQAIRAQSAQAKDAVQQAGAEQKDAVKQSGDEALGHIAGARKALDLSAEQKLEAARGQTDPEVIRLKRDRLSDDVNRKIADAVVAADEAGKRRKAQLRALADLMKAAYRRRAEDDETKLVADATAAKSDIKAAQLTAAQSFNWADAKKTELDKFVLAQTELTDSSVKALQDDTRTAGTTARELIRNWADEKLGEQRSWLQKLLDKFVDWYKAAMAESRAWETQRNKATRDAVASDIIALNTAIVLGGEDVDVDAEGALSDLSDEQQAVFKAYYSKTSATKGDSIAAVAAGLRVRIAKERAPALVQQLETLLDEQPAEKCVELEALARAETPSFSAAYVSDEVYAALHGGLTGWNEESRVFNALTGLTKAQSRAVRAYYQNDHGLNLESDLKSELKSTFRKYDPEADRAVALLNNEPESADAANIYYALHGGLGINDTDAVMKALRNKSPAQQAKIKKFYLDKYKLDLDDDLHGELKPLITNDTHDDEQAKALRAGDVNRADTIAVDSALHGGIFGRGGVFKADTDKIEAVHKQIREDVKAQLDAKAAAEARAGGREPTATSAEIEAEVARRNRQLESAYGVVYGKAGDAKDASGDSALRAAYKDRFGNNPKDDARIQLVTGLLDNDLTKADAAKLAIEHQSLVYASDEIQNNVLEEQYKRALEAKRRDVGPGLRRAMQKRRDEDARNGQPWDIYKVRAEEKKIEKQLEDEAKGLAKLNMDNLRTTYDSTVGAYGEGSFGFQINRFTSGYDLDKSKLLREQGGYLSPAQQVFFATEGVGTSGDQFKAALKGKSKEEIAQIERDLLEVRADQIARSDWRWKSPAEVKRLKEQWIKDHSKDTLSELVGDETSGRLKWELNLALRGEPQNEKDEIQLARDKLAYEKGMHGASLIDAVPGLGAARALGNWRSQHELDVLEKRMKRLEDQYKLVDEQNALIKAAANDPSVTPADRAKLLEERVNRLARFGQISTSVDSAVEKHAEQVNAVADAVVKVVATTVAVVALVVVAIGSAGTAVPAEIAAVSAFLTSAAGAATVAAATAVVGVAIKAAMLGDTYEGETALKELGIGGVDALVSAATAGVGGKFLSSAFDQLAVKLAKEGWTKAEIAALKVMMSEGALQKPMLGRLAAKGPVSSFLVHGLVSSGENFAQGLPSTVLGVALDRSPGDPGKKLQQALKGHAIQSAAMGYGGHALTAGIGKAAAKVWPERVNTPPVAGNDPKATVREGDRAATGQTGERTAVKPDDPVLKSTDELPANRRGEDKIAADAQEALQKGELQTAEQKTKPTTARDNAPEAPTEPLPEHKKAQATDDAAAKPKASTDDPQVNPPRKAPDTPETSSMSGTQHSGSLLHAPPEPAPGRITQAWNNAKKRYYQYQHDRWVKSVLEGGMAAGRPPKAGNPGPPFTDNHFTYREGIYSPEKAYQAYNEALARANGREVGIYRDTLTGEYIVRVGDHGSVGGPHRNGNAVETVLHYHPNNENVLVYRMPAPNDVQNTWNRAQANQPAQRPLTEFVEFPLPDGSRGRTAWTVVPAGEHTDARIIVEYVNAKGERVRQEFSHPTEFAEEWGSRTRFVDPDPKNPQYQDLRRDIDEWLRRNGHRDIAETDLVPDFGDSSMARSGRAAAKPAGPPAPNPRKSYAESEWRSFIDNPPKGKTGDDMRYLRYLQHFREENGSIRGAMDRSDWQAVKDVLEANRARGRVDEDNALASAGVENNNYTTSTVTGDARDIVRYESKKVSPGEVIETRPDGVTEKYWVDVKATEQDTIFYTEQLKVQKEGAAKEKPPRKLAVIITNDNPGGVRPSNVLETEALVLHRDSKTGKWRMWDTRLNDGQGGWGSAITKEDVSKLLGGATPR